MLFLGIYDSAISDFKPAEIEELESAISRVQQKRNVISQPHLTLVTVDFNESEAGGGTFFLEDDPNKTGVVVGRPYLIMKDELADTSALIDALKNRDLSRLAATRGSFCGFCFDKKTKILTLCSDKVGVFPIYIATVGSRIYFSNALRMLRNIGAVPKKLVPERLFSNMAFGYCLDRDTVFADIDRIYGGEMVEVSQSGIQNRQYWNWDKIEPIDYNSTELEDQIYQSFIDAVQIRCDSSPGELSFLSGGLDSRCIVAALRNIGRPVWTLNFAPEGSQDHLFGRLAASALGAQHYELGLGSDNFSKRQKKILDSWADENKSWVAQGVKPYRVWSGDGGSVGLGHVYLDDKFVNLLREKQVSKACQCLMIDEKLGLPIGMLPHEMKQVAQHVPLEKMVKEIKSFSPPDPAKSGFLFFLLNDQRHHLADYFENLDLYQFEVILPFFDSKLLELIVAAPIDGFLGHAFYNRWLEKFGPAISTVPWQAYPGHVPCPVSTEQYGKLRYQWNEDWFDEKENQRKRQEELKTWRVMLNNKCFPSVFLSKNKLTIAYWLTRLNIRDYKYALDAANKIVLFANVTKKY